MILDEYADAVEFKNIQRHVIPPVYNPRRLYEAPIANTSQFTSANEHDFDLEASTSQHSTPESSTTEYSDFEEVEIPNENNENVEEQHDPLLVKAEIITNHVNNNEIDNLANVRLVKIDEDLIMIIEGDDANAFIPKQSQLGVKRNDEFSGTLPYEEDVCNSILHILINNLCCSVLVHTIFHTIIIFIPNCIFFSRKTKSVTT